MGIFLLLGSFIILFVSFLLITGCETLDPIFHKFDINGILFLIGVIVSAVCLISGLAIIGIEISKFLGVNI